MKINEEYTLKIEKMLSEGYGLSRIDKFPIFVMNACSSDILKVKIVKLNKSYAIASIIEIVEASEFRIKPVCSLHNVCGSCDWQHIEYSEQLRQKRLIVSETIKKISAIDIDVNETIPSPQTLYYRCKVQVPVQQTKVSKRFLTGYYKTNSHEIINIKHCFLHPDIINKINEYIKEELSYSNITAYNEKKHIGDLRHIIYRISSDLKQILIIFVVNSKNIENELNKISKKIKEKFPQVIGFCVNYNFLKTNVIMGQETKLLSGNDFYIETLGKIQYKISANSFFQVNPDCATIIFDTVKNLIKQKVKNPKILDAYSGVSSFGIWLSDIAEKVVSIEEVISASNDAQQNLLINRKDNIQILNGDAALEFKKLINNNEKFDVSLIDPPRKGCTQQAIDNLVMLSKKYIIYVSCNVSTLARDMVQLNIKGFKPIYIQPVDMFPNTHHIETIVMFEKINN